MMPLRSIARDFPPRSAGWCRHLAALLFATGLGCGVALAADPAPATPANSDSALALKKMAERSKLTKTRINALLRDRLSPPPPPVNVPNPFQIGAGGTVALTAPPPGPEEQVATVEVVTPEIPEAEPNPDVATLARFVSELKITGHFILGGVSRLTINSVLYKEGDLIRQGAPEAPYYIKIEKVTADELTLRLNEVVQTVKFKI